MNMNTAEVRKSPTFVSNVTNTKSSLAKIMSGEDITVIHSAACSGPQFNVETRVLTLPIFSDTVTNDMYDLFVGHEVGHALFTDPVKYVDIQKKVLSTFFNTEEPTQELMMKITVAVCVIEDARIEKLIKRKYPGLIRSFNVGYIDLLNDGVFGKYEDIKSIDYFLDRINLNFKIGTHFNQSFDPEEQEIVDEIANLETMEDLESAVMKVFQKIKDDVEKRAKEQAEQNKQNKEGKGKPNRGEKGKKGTSKTTSNGKSQGSGQENDQNNQDDGYGQENQENDYDQDDQDEGDEEGDGDGQDGEGEDQNEDGKPKDANKDGDKKEEDIVGKKQVAPVNAPGAKSGKFYHKPNIVESISVKSMENYDVNYNKYISKNNVDYVYLTVNNKLDYKKYIVPYSEYNKKMEEFYTNNNRLTIPSMLIKAKAKVTELRIKEKRKISYMIKEFELRKAAKNYAKEKIEKTGVIDTTKMCSYQFRDDIFKRNLIEHKGKSHGVVYLMDWSGSMSSSLRNTVEQLLSLSMFCKQINIPFEVYLFSNSHRYNNHNVRHVPLEIDFASDIQLINVLSSRMSNVDYTKALTNIFSAAEGNYGCYPLTGTPLNSSLMLMSKLINDFKNNNKLDSVTFTVLTDGDSCPNSITIPSSNQNTFTGKNIVYKHLLKTGKGKVVSLDGITTNKFTLNIKSLTKGLIEKIRIETGANTMCFYIVSSENEIKNKIENVLPPDEAKKALESFRKNNHCIVNGAMGYDKHFFVKPFSNISSNSSGDNFMENIKQQKNIRIILNNFIESMTKNTT